MRFKVYCHSSLDEAQGELIGAAVAALCRLDEVGSQALAVFCDWTAPGSKLTEEQVARGQIVGAQLRGQVRLAQRHVSAAGTPRSAARSRDLDALDRSISDWLMKLRESVNLPARRPGWDAIQLLLTGNRRVKAILAQMRAELAGEPTEEDFVPNVVQVSILNSLDTRALSLSGLEGATGLSRRQLYERKGKITGGLKELQQVGLVLNGEYGFYRPDRPPPASIAA